MPMSNLSSASLSAWTTVTSSRLPHLDGVNAAIADLDDAKGEAKGGLGIVDALFFPGDGVVKSRTQCTEQGSGRWLPKPTDVVATFFGSPTLT